MTRALLRNPNYLFFWIGASVSNLGSALSMIAYPLLVLVSGGSAAQAGAVGSAALISRIVFRLPAGHVVDLLDRRRLMIALDLVRVIAVGSIPLVYFTGSLPFALLIGVALIEGAASAAYQPASTVLLRDVVSTDQVTTAMSQFQAASGTIMTVGPALGGALFAIQPTLPFLLDAISYAVSAIALLPVRGRAAEPVEKKDRRVLAGLRWLWGNPTLSRQLLFATVLNLATGAAEVVVVVGLREHGTSSAAIGIVMGCAGLGAIIGAIGAPRILRRLPSTGLQLTIGLIWTVGALGLLFGRSPFVVGPILAALMLLTPATGIRLAQLTMTNAPHQLLGRVSTAQAIFSNGLASVGPGLAGLLLEHAGVGATWLTLSALCLLATAVMLVRVPRVVVAEPEVLAHQETDPA